MSLGSVLPREGEEDTAAETGPARRQRARPASAACRGLLYAR